MMKKYAGPAYALIRPVLLSPLAEGMIRAKPIHADTDAEAVAKATSAVRGLRDEGMDGVYTLVRLVADYDSDGTSGTYSVAAAVNAKEDR